MTRRDAILRILAVGSAVPILRKVTEVQPDEAADSFARQYFSHGVTSPIPIIYGDSGTVNDASSFHINWIES